MRKIVGLLVFVSTTLIMFAQDTVVVQTLNFDMITQRRGIFKFPDDPTQFRKILMKYTLKCDPRTTQDNFPCGEWDYLTYNVIYKPTGRYDSTYYEHPYFRIGWDAPDSLEYSSIQPENKYRKYFYSNKLTNPQNEETFNLGSATGELSLTGKKGRIQFILSSKELKDNGLIKGDFQRLALYVKQGGDAVYRVAIRAKAAPVGQLTSFVNAGFDTLFFYDISFDQTGTKILDLTKKLNWSGFSGLMFDISYEKLSGTTEPILDGFSSTKCLTTSGLDNYLYFDGQNDYVIFDKNLKALNNAEKFTVELWLNVNKWESWNRVFGNEKTCIELGDKPGQLYCIVRTKDNTNGNAQSAIGLNDWYHVAMVYDGTQPGNDKKIRLFVNGELRSLTFSPNEIPSRTSSEIYPTSLNSGYFNNQTMNGSMDEVRIWSSALPDSVISKWFNRSIDNSHPDYSALTAYYTLNKDYETQISDEAKALYPGKLFGCPDWIEFNAMDCFKNPVSIAFAPKISLMRGTYESKTDSLLSIKSVKQSPVSLMKFSIVNFKPEPTDVSYVWKSGYSYTYNPDGSKLDSLPIQKQATIKNYKLKYYGKPFEVFYEWEIGRYITPYGINLDLGPDGFTWYYDVTDYAPLLKGDVDFMAGNQQELIDVKFLFIKGTAPRDVLSIQEPWGSFRSYSYKELSDDTKLKKTSVPTNPLAKQFKMRSRFTGHGHNSNNGQYPHCCEWKDNTHYLLVNDKEFANWHVWRENDCGKNPVFPQGGTWPGAREGWCPGDVVSDFDFDITGSVANNQVNLDYDITKLPTDNQGMGGGNYVVAMQLFEYSENKFSNDIEIYNVIMPSSNPLYSRMNPICANPIVVVRNNGKNVLTSMTLKYKVSGGKEETYNWNGSIASNTIQNITLPTSGSSFWIGDGKNQFTVEAVAGAMAADEYPDNNKFMTDFKMPDLLPEKIIIEYKTNNRPTNYAYELKDINGVPVHNKRFSVTDRVFFDTVNVPKGCYTFSLTDQYDMGLSYWAYPDQGSGYLRILNMQGKPIKTFNSDFGHMIYYSFNLGDVTFVQENDESNFIEIFPNPASGNINVMVNYDLGQAELSIVNIDGEEFKLSNEDLTRDFNKTYNLPELPAGVYFLRVMNGSKNIVKKFIRK